MEQARELLKESPTSILKVRKQCLKNQQTLSKNNLITLKQRRIN